MPVMRMEVPDLPAAIFRNGAASSFKAKQTSECMTSNIKANTAA
jgi:hypothetical protein